MLGFLTRSRFFQNYFEEEKGGAFNGRAVERAQQTLCPDPRGTRMDERVPQSPYCDLPRNLRDGI
jgi:hypothetical protein